MIQLRCALVVLLAVGTCSCRYDSFGPYISPLAGWFDADLNGVFAFNELHPVGWERRSPTATDPLLDIPRPDDLFNFPYISTPPKRARANDLTVSTGEYKVSFSSSPLFPNLGSSVTASIFTTPRAPMDKIFVAIGTGGIVDGALPCDKSANAPDANCSGPVTGANDAAAGSVSLVAGSLPFTFDITVTNPSGSTTTATLTEDSAGSSKNANHAYLTEDPISTATGELVDGPFVDLNLGGPLPLTFRRWYGTTLGALTGPSAVGFNWLTNFDPYLTVVGNLAAVAVEGGGSTSFQLSGGNYTTVFPPRVAFQLVQNANGYQYLDPTTNLISIFNAKGNLIRIEDRKGNALTVTPGGPNGAPSEVSDGLGRTLKFTYNSGGQLTAVQDQSGRSVTYAQDANMNLTSVTDANGNATTYNYLGNELTKTVRPAGNVPYTQTFDPSTGSAVTQTDSEGNVTTLGYVAGGNPGDTVMTDALGRATTFKYADLVDLSSFTDAAGKMATYTYDDRQRPLTYTDRLGNTTSMSYDEASGYVATIADAKGKTTTFTYGAQVQGDFTFYNLTQVTFADGTMRAFTYDGSGNVLTTTDQAGKITKYTYNSRGQVLTSTNPAGGITTYAYNSDGTRATTTDPPGNVTAYGYDSLKRLATIQRGGKTTTTYTRDALDHILSVTNGQGNVTHFAYDANSNLKSVTDALNKAAAASYDTDDLLSSMTDRLGNTSKVAYDPLGNATAITDAAGETTTFTYDSLYRLESVVDPAGKGPSFTHDAEGRLTSLTDADGDTAKFTRDQLGRITGITSPLGENTSISYDALSRVTSITDALSRTASFTYEKRGLPAGIAAPGGIGTSISWGALPVPTSIADPDGNAWNLGYDTQGRLTGITDPLGQAVNYSYNSRNRLSSVTSAVDSIQISYDGADDLTLAKYSDGSSVSFTYDADKRLVSGTGLALTRDADGRLTGSNGLAITRDAVGRIASITYTAGKTATYSYDSRGLLAKISDWAGGSVSFTFDAAHRLTSLSRSNGVTTQYTYDADGRLASIADTSGGTAIASIALTRDAIGRVTLANRSVPQEAEPGGSGILPLGFDAANQISGFTYDARGRLTAGDAGSTYKWNPASRLLSYARADGSASFTYDGLGQRISRTSASGTNNYVVNYATGLPTVATVQSGGSDVRYYIYTPSGALLYSIEAASGAHHFYSFDETGSTTFLTGDDGLVTDTYGISPYGDVITAGASNTTDNPFTWQGEWGVMQEPGTSLFYARFRYYDASFGRFLSRDPLFSAAPREVNPYQYAAGDPVTFTDPRGLKTAHHPTPCEDEKGWKEFFGAPWAWWFYTKPANNAPSTKTVEETIMSATGAELLADIEAAISGPILPEVDIVPDLQGPPGEMPPVDPEEDPEEYDDLFLPGAMTPKRSSSIAQLNGLALWALDR